MIEGFDKSQSGFAHGGSLQADRSLDALVDFIKGFRQDLGALTALYGQMPALIGAEHEAIKSGNFNIVRDATAAKIAVCDQIAESHESLVNQCRALPELSAQLTGVRCEAPATLSACLSRLVDLAEHLTSRRSMDGQAQGPAALANSLTRDMLQKLLDGSTTNLESFLEVAEQVKSRVEANRVVLEKMLNNYQDSYRFWMEMASEAQSSYDAKGVQRSNGVASGLRIKA